MLKTVPLPDIKLGIDMLSDETSLPKGAVRMATNIDFDRAGNFNRRAGYTKVVNDVDFHSIRTMNQRGIVLVAKAGVLNTFDPTTYALTPVFDLHTTEPVDYTEHNGNVYFTNRSTIGWLPADATTWRSLGVVVPPGPICTPITTGALSPAKYTVAVSYVDDRGEESGLSPLTTVEVLAGFSGISLSGLQVVSGYRYRVYVTPPNGDVLYLNKEFTASYTTTKIDDQTQLRQADTFGLDTMMPGDFIRAHNGRLITGKDNVLYFSAPLRYGLRNPAHDHIMVSGMITFIEPVLGGVYVGAGTTVWFLEGGDPEKFVAKRVSTCKAIPRSSILIPGEHLPPKLVSPYPVALWLSTSGYTVGMADGSVVELHPDRIRVPPQQSGRSIFMIRDGIKQVVTVVNSAVSAGYGYAVDSPISPRITVGGVDESGVGTPSVS